MATAREFTAFVIGGRNLPQVNTSRGPGPCNAYCTLMLLHPQEPVPEEGLVSMDVKGTQTSFVNQNANPVFNSEIVMRKRKSGGAHFMHVFQLLCRSLHSLSVMFSPFFPLFFTLHEAYACLASVPHRHAWCEMTILPLFLQRSCLDPACSSQVKNLHHFLDVIAAYCSRPETSIALACRK
jgi:hypothetical protein